MGSGNYKVVEKVLSADKQTADRSPKEERESKQGNAVGWHDLRKKKVRETRNELIAN